MLHSCTRRKQGGNVDGQRVCISADWTELIGGCYWCYFWVPSKTYLMHHGKYVFHTWATSTWVHIGHSWVRLLWNTSLPLISWLLVPPASRYYAGISWMVFQEAFLKKFNSSEKHTFFPTPLLPASCLEKLMWLQEFQEPFWTMRHFAYENLRFGGAKKM